MYFRAAVSAFALATPAVAQAPTDLALVSQYLRGLQTLTATFTQTDRAGKVLNGVLTLKQPGKVRFQYEKGVPLLIVSDGRALTMIDYQVNQVSRWPIGSSPLGVLLDPRKDLSRVARLVPSGDPRVVMVEARDAKHPEYGVITIAYSRDAGGSGGLKMQGWVALDAQNNRTTVRLSNQKLNAPISDQAFAWRDPRPKNRGR